jgi:hypothetical protein
MKNAVALPILVAAMLLCVALTAKAQQPARIPRIGILITGGSLSFNSARVEALRQRLREHGYVEGKTLSSSTDMQKGNANGCLTLQPNWSVSKWTSSSPPAPCLF